MITDLFGYISRNVKKWSIKDKEKIYNEMKRIVIMLERELNLKGM